MNVRLNKTHIQFETVLRLEVVKINSRNEHCERCECHLHSQIRF